MKESKIDRIIQFLSKFLNGKDFWIGRVEKRMLGVKWIYHENDEDPFPSVPHLHSNSDRKGYKLNIYTREIYDIATKKITDKKITQKEFKALWSDKSFVSFVVRAREKYLKENPNIQLPPMPDIKCKDSKVSILKPDGNIEI